MNFHEMYVPDLLSVLPNGNEDDKWELKSAEYLRREKKSDLKKELGKQVSAFANSGGGYLIFGIDDQRTPQECENTVGRQSMKDYLSTMVEQSVEYPIRDFRVHPIQFAEGDDRSIYVLDIGDSVAAPHQAKDEKKYYYRIDGHSKPAPHFHLELLRNRMTKAVLSIQNVELVGITPFVHLQPGKVRHMAISLSVSVLNESLQSAKDWGVHIHSDNMTWQPYHRNSQKFQPRSCVYGKDILLPDDLQSVQSSVGTVNNFHSDDPVHFFESEPYKRWEAMGLVLRPVSDNCIGAEFRFPSTDPEVNKTQLERFRVAIEQTPPPPQIHTRN